MYTQLQFLAEHKSACSYTTGVSPEHKSVCSYTASVRSLTHFTAVSSTVVGGAVGGAVVLLVVVLLCGFGTGVVAVYLLRQRKRKHQSM